MPEGVDIKPKITKGGKGGGKKRKGSDSDSVSMAHVERVSLLTGI
jgi:hypothetical protein